MSPSQPDEVAAASPPRRQIPAVYAGEGDPTKAGSIDLKGLDAKGIRDIVRLLQCQLCSLPLQNPFTLPCGNTLCKRCLPETHERTNISYPGTASRLQGFKCPFPDCGKDHASSDCGPDVLLNKALATLRSELGSARNDATKSHSEVIITVADDDGWAVTGIPSLKEAEETPVRRIRGGRVLATYTLVEEGELRYHAEVSYESATPMTHDTAEDADWSILKAMESSMRVEMDCQVCFSLIFEPITTPCGHTFCKHCLDRVLDHAALCPICRRALSIQSVIRRDACPQNDLLKRLTTIFWREDLEARKTFVISEGLAGTPEHNTPVFVCTLAFPHMPTFLHIFEARYRLMIRRAMQGDRKFGMVNYRQQDAGSNRNFEELGTMLYIVSAEFFPDGRSLLETVGVSRFRIVEHGIHDEYVVARTEVISDISIAEEEELESSEVRAALAMQDTVMEAGEAIERGEAPASPTSPMSTSSTTSNPLSHRSSSSGQPILTMANMDSKTTQELMDFAASFVQRMRGQSVSWLARRILTFYGECPEDPARFPWWLASILPVRDDEKYRLLSTTSVRERLKICCGWILEWESHRWSLSACSIL